MGLRPYQTAAVEAIEREWGAGRSRTLLVQATGTGKTVVMAEMARRECERGGRTLLLAHRGELLQQAADKIGAFAGLLCGVEKAQEKGDAEKVADYTDILYNQALLVEGLPIDDPVAFSSKICELMK